MSGENLVTIFTLFSLLHSMMSLWIFIVRVKTLTLDCPPCETPISALHTITAALRPHVEFYKNEQCFSYIIIDSLVSLKNGDNAFSVIFLDL